MATVTRGDLVQWHRTYVHPNNIILAVTGDFNPKTMEEKLRAAFESWPRVPSAAPTEVTFSGPRPGLYFIPYGVDQSYIRVVGLGTRMDSPDYYSLTVLSWILGGGFSSRLFEALRAKTGLAYDVGTQPPVAFDHPALFQITMATKSGTTAAAIEALEKEIDRLKSEPPTAEELRRAEDSVLNSFVFLFGSKQLMLAARMNYEFYGYPADFLERYLAGVEKVTLADVARVAEKYGSKGSVGRSGGGQPVTL